MSSKMKVDVSSSRGLIDCVACPANCECAVSLEEKEFDTDFTHDRLSRKNIAL